MNYSIGSVADLISGKNTPNKPIIKEKKIAVNREPPFDNENNSNKQNDSKRKKNKLKRDKRKIVSTINIKEEKVDIGPIKVRDRMQELRTIFVGNVPIEVNKSKIKKLFHRFGPVENIRVRCVAPNDPNISKKVALIKKKIHPKRKTVNCFVRFENEEDAKKALELNGYEFKGNHLRVNLSINNEKPDENKALFVGNLPFDAEDDDLWHLFEIIGKISSVRIVRDPISAMGKGFGYVNFESSDSVELALEQGNFELKDRELRISRCGNTSKKKLKIKKERPNNKTKNHKKKSEISDKVSYSKPQKTISAAFQGTKAEIKKKKKVDKSLLKKRIISKILTSKNNKKPITT